jgi:hypothetical protein
MNEEKKRGAPFKYKAEELEILFDKYKEHRNKEYDVRYDSIKSGERAGETIEIKIPKVYTIASFCHFIGLTEKTFFNWINGVSEEMDEKLFQFVTRVREEIKDCQFSGATNGIYNASIVSRSLGLTDNINIESSQALNPVTINILGESLNIKGLYEPFQEAEIIQ